MTSLDAYSLNLGDIPDLMANVSTLHMTSVEEVQWRDLGIDTNKEVILVSINNLLIKTFLLCHF